jgi:hypothetical protein
MVPLLEQWYDGCGTNPPAAEEQKDRLRGTPARVDSSQLRASYVCSSCNHHKGPNLAGIDPRTRRRTWLFNPRRDSWGRHFRWDGPGLVGRTPTGRASVAVLALNLPHRVAQRAALMEEGVFPS